MLRIDMLPGGNGDALWIEYGDVGAPRRILVDGGTKGSWDDPDGLRARIEALPAGERSFELLVVTHVDGDHIEGALALLQTDALGVTYGDVWFNGWRHLPQTLEPRGPVEGELLTDAIVHRGLPWNDAFGGGAVVVPFHGPLRSAELADEMKVTVLGPGPEQLVALKPEWRTAVEEAGLDPDKPRPVPAADEPLSPGAAVLATKPDVDALAASAFHQDTAKPNGSSIVLLLEHDDATALLTGDAFPSVVLQGVGRYLADIGESRLALDAFKTPHHGSRANVSSELLEALDCKRHLISSNGSKTSHPHPEAVGRTIASAGPGSTLFFNYSTRFNDLWADAELRDLHRYETVYPDAGRFGVSVKLGGD
jgi:glyoxylase-like metal-dependent hydrolase (beta-lactamase superfamily II)